MRVESGQHGVPEPPPPPVPTGPKMVAVQNYHGNPAPPGKPVLTFQTGDVIELLRGDPESQWWEVGGPCTQAERVGVSGRGGGKRAVAVPWEGGGALTEAVLASRPPAASPRPAHPPRCDRGRQSRWPRRDALLLCQRRAGGQLPGAWGSFSGRGDGEGEAEPPPPWPPRRGLRG